MNPLFWAYFIMLAVCLVCLIIILVVSTSISEATKGEGGALLLCAGFSLLGSALVVSVAGPALTKALNLPDFAWLTWIFIAMCILGPLTYFCGYLFVGFFEAASRGI